MTQRFAQHLRHPAAFMAMVVLSFWLVVYSFSGASVVTTRDNVIGAQAFGHNVNAAVAPQPLQVSDFQVVHFKNGVETFVLKPASQVAIGHIDQSAS